MPDLRLSTAGLTDLGRVRTNNEDGVWVDPDCGLLIVADGMGGHQSGEVASGLVIKTVPENFKMLAKANNSGAVANPKYSPETNRLGFCVKIANQMIFEASKKYAHERGMGTTCTAAVISGDRLGVAHVGDSRAYLLRKGDLQQLTRDHSLVMDQVRQGLITKEEAAKSNLQNILTRALGTQPEVEVDLDEHPLFPGDVVMLCSDGLFKHLPDEQILQAASQEADPQALAARLVKEANEAGGTDNVTVAVARMEPAGGFAEKLKRFFSRK